MGIDLTAWASNRIVQLVVGALAIVGVIAAPIAVWQTFEIDGFSLFGWTIADGLRNEAANTKTAIANLKICQANEAKLDNAIASQNSSLSVLHSDYVALQAQAGRNATDAAIADNKAAALAGAIMAMKPSGDLCKAALNLVHKEGAP
jgi:hypothetical protein